MLSAWVAVAELRRWHRKECRHGSLGPHGRCLRLGVAGLAFSEVEVVEVGPDCLAG